MKGTPKNTVFIRETPLVDRTDLDDLFWIDDETLAMQQKLDIETFKEAKEKGHFVPKPRQGDIHISLRKIRRLTLKAHEYGLLNSTDLIELIKQLVNFLRSGDEDTLRKELKKLIYVLMLDKKYAETIDGTLAELLALSFEKSLERLPMSWTDFLKKTEPEDIFLALDEIYRDLHPLDDDGFTTIKNPEREAETKEKYPHFFKIWFGEKHVIFPFVKDEEEYERKKKIKSEEKSLCNKQLP